MKTVLIVGMGQIGRSIYELYKPLKKYTLYYMDSNNIEDIEDITNIQEESDAEIDYMHVCIPYDAALFELQVTNYINEYLPALTIIHSTVDIGTTRSIYKKTGAPICYSPVMGIHPKLTKSILTFEKILGGITDWYTDVAKRHLEDAKIKVRLFSNPENAEAAKLLDTTYYGWNIMYMKEVYVFCLENQLSFDEVYKATNEIYNTGYKKLDMPNVVRPVLKYIPNKIGGHCVIPNCKIIRKYFYPAKIITERDA
jgi:UDP-N-acetyl-D-mannosaminuronate dehydrogenase